MWFDDADVPCLVYGKGLDRFSIVGLIYIFIYMVLFYRNTVVSTSFYRILLTCLKYFPIF